MYEELIGKLKRWPRVCVQYDNSIDELLDKAADAIEELSKPRWIPVTERLPEENGYYLTYVESAFFPNHYYINMIKFVDGDFIEDHCVIHRVTHWMSLPEPPKEET